MVENDKKMMIFTLSLLSLKKRLQNYYLPFELAELIPLYSNFEVEQDCSSCKLISPKAFHENYYTIQQLMCLQNLNIYHSIILSNDQYSLINSFEFTQKNEGSFCFVFLWYYLIYVMLYWIIFPGKNAYTNANVI